MVCPVSAYDKLAEDVKLGARLIKELDKKLKQVRVDQSRTSA
jgi:hypothetical protein